MPPNLEYFLPNPLQTPFTTRAPMNNLFLAKIPHHNTTTLIYTDGIKYSLISDYFPETSTLTDFLQLEVDTLPPTPITLLHLLPPDIQYLPLIEDFPIFATGCTYEWSPEKLISLKDDDVYRQVYLSQRSMFFYKGNKTNIADNQCKIGIRADSTLTIPEAEIVVVFNRQGKIIGHTIGNDVTAVDIEKENPLFQMQAKFYQGSVALLPMIKLGTGLPMTNLHCNVIREGECISKTSYHTEGFNRSTQKIVDQLMQMGVTPNGGFLFIGCGVSHPKDKGLKAKDTVIISSDFLPLALQNECRKI
jgi:2-dehydro-3-deoxy-D-arabinonate dehydratase